MASDRRDPGDSSRYTVLGEIARGGLGRVFSATDDALGRTVAIKQVLDPSPEAMMRFEREAKLTARLQHAGVVPIYDIGRWRNGEPFFVMKMVEGRSLADLIGEAHSFADRLALLPRVLAVCDTMGYVHGREVIHRDLKPANVIISRHGETVVIDWGLATVTSAGAADPAGLDLVPSSGPDSVLSQAGKVLGTLQFMAPEQARGEILDQRADVYALGATLYNVLAGEEPYADTGKPAAGAKVELFQQVRAGPPAPLRARVPGVPGDLLAIVEKAMAREARHRYASARELAQDLRRFLDGQLVSAHHYRAHVLVGRWLRRHRAAVTVAAVLLAALAAAAVVGVRRVVEERNAAVEARRVAVAGQDALMLMQAERSLAEDPTAALAWLKRRRRADEAWLQRLVAEEAVARGVARHVFTGATSTRAPAVSATDPLVAFGGADGAVTVRHLDAPRRKRLLGHRAAVMQVAYSPREPLLASVDAGGELRLWAPDGNVRHRVALGEAPAGRFLGLAFSSDGRRVAVGLADKVAVVPVDEPAGLKVHPLGDRYGWMSFCDDGTLLVGTMVEGAVQALAAGGEGWRRVGRHPDARLLCLPGSRAFVTAGLDGEVRLWDLAARAPASARVIGRHDDWVIAVAASPDGRLVATGSGDDTVRVYDLAGGGPTHILRGHEDGVRGVVFARDGRRLASASRGSVRVWDLATAEVVRVYPSPLTQTDALALTSDGRHVLAAGPAEARVWPLEGPLGRALLGHKDFVTWVSWSPDGRQMASGSRDRTARVWDLARATSWATGPLDSWVMEGRFLDGARLLLGTRATRALTLDLTTRKLEPIPLPPPAVSGLSPSLVFAPGGAHVVASDGAGVVVHHVGSGRTVRLEGSFEGVSGIDFPDDGRAVAVTTSRGLAGLWDPDTGKAVATKRFEGFPIRDMSVSGDGKRLALLGGDDSRIAVWEPAGGRVLAVPTTGEPIAWLFFTRDGRTVGSLDGARVAVRLAPIEGGGPARTLRGHRAPVLQVVTSPDGALLATGDSDGMVRLWDVRSERSVLFKAHAAAIDSIAFSPDGRRVATAGQEAAPGAIRLWELAELPLATPPTPAAMETWLAARTSAVVDGARTLRTPPGDGN